MFKMSSLSFVVIGLLIFTERSDGLKCYFCKAAVPADGSDPCWQAKLKECNETNSFCLSAKITITDPDQSFRLVARSCVQKQYEGEDICNSYRETTKIIPDPSLKAEVHLETCNLCTKDGCNRPNIHQFFRVIELNAAPSRTLSLFLFTGVLGYAIGNFFNGF